MTSDQMHSPTFLLPSEILNVEEEPLVADEGVVHRILWDDGVSTAGVMTVEAGHALSPHVHRRHHHHVWVVGGRARILGTEAEPGTYVHIPRGVEHGIDASLGSACTVFYLYTAQEER